MVISGCKKCVFSEWVGPERQSLSKNRVQKIEVSRKNERSIVCVSVEVRGAVVYPLIVSPFRVRSKLSSASTFQPCFPSIYRPRIAAKPVSNNVDIYDYSQKRKRRYSTMVAAHVFLTYRNTSRLIHFLPP